MIRVANLSKSYGKLLVLDQLSLEIERPGIYAILGPNGSGKTTLMKSILGLVHPDHGTVYFQSEPIAGKWTYRSQIDYMPQIANFPPNLKVKELLELLQNLRASRANTGELIQRFELQHHLNKSFGNLSGGTKQKVNVVASLMFDSPLVILDEPTTGLDPIAMITLKELLSELRNLGKTIILSSHIINFVEEVADEIIFILEGKIHFQGNQKKLTENTGTEKLEEAIASLLRSNHDS